jgi:hypothetical protein
MPTLTVTDMPLFGTRRRLTSGGPVVGGDSGDNAIRPPSHEELFASVARPSQPASGVGDSFSLHTETTDMDLEAGTCTMVFVCTSQSWLDAISAKVTGVSAAASKTALSISTNLVDDSTFESLRG